MSRGFEDKSNTIYQGYITPNKECRVRVIQSPRTYQLDPRLDLRSHSPTGFAWGYAGSGPAQLALALLADATGDDRVAEAHYQFFKDEFLVRLNKDEAWELSWRAVMGWLQMQPARAYPGPNEEEGQQ